MDSPVSPLIDFDIAVFKEELAKFKEEVLAQDDNEQQAFYLELIKLLEEEIAKRKSNISVNLRSDIQFFAYINLFHTLVEGDFDDSLFDEDFDEEFNLDEDEEE